MQTLKYARRNVSLIKNVDRGSCVSFFSFRFFFFWKGTKRMYGHLFSKWKHAIRGFHFLKTSVQGRKGMQRVPIIQVETCNHTGLHVWKSYFFRKWITSLKCICKMTSIFSFVLYSFHLYFFLVEKICQCFKIPVDLTEMSFKSAPSCL